ncbi:MAG: nicotinate-nucleotide--dimethylbenzimidazole phosphoribosyltransferase, partial [Bacilli bacterium]
IASHQSNEQAHKHVLATMELSPLLTVEMRLGEASGAALMLPLIEASERLLHEMATFESAAVTGPGL